MRLATLALMLLSACAPIPAYEVIGCPASDGWSDEDHARLADEYPQLRACCPESARALVEYDELKADRCAFYSGLREYE